MIAAMLKNIVKMRRMIEKINKMNKKAEAVFRELKLRANNLFVH